MPQGPEGALNESVLAAAVAAKAVTVAAAAEIAGGRF